MGDAKYSTVKAKEIEDILGISPQKVGIILNREHLKTDHFGKWYHDKPKKDGAKFNT